MACNNCSKPTRSSLWTPVPESYQPSEIQPGENIDCYMARSGSQSGLMNDVGPKLVDRIDNTALTSDLALNVDVTFKLTPSSTRTPTAWQVSVDGTSGLAPLTELTFDATTGRLHGTVSAVNANKNYRVLVAAQDLTGEIDSREFTFFPKQADKSTVVKFIIPLIPGPNSSSTAAPHVTCGFGPRQPPAQGASTDHKGNDFALTDHTRGYIVAAADGVVVRTGPATGFGNAVFIEHSDAQGNLVATTVYGHMNDGDTYVAVGERVAQGQKIALEGNAGIGSASHLHFEIHKGKWKHPVDPAPYLEGSLEVATDNTAVQGPDGTPTPTAFTSQANVNVGMTSTESSSTQPCDDVIPGTNPSSNPAIPGPPITPEPATLPPLAIPTSNISPNRSACAGATPTPSEILTTIATQCTNAGLSAEETKFIQTVALIESGLDPYAKCPTSSATGLFQFLDGLAVPYYKKIGVPPTCANRCDPVYATQAMIQYFTDTIRPVHTNWVSSGYTTIAGKPIVPTDFSTPNYLGSSSLTFGEFCYGCVHHDGVGTWVKGKDLGGLTYWRKKVRALPNP